MERRDASLGRLVRGAGSRERLRPLLEALGMDWLPGASPVAAPVRCDDVAARLTRVAHAPGWSTILCELAGEPAAEEATGLVRALDRAGGVGHRLYVLASPSYRRLTLATVGLDGRVRQLTMERARPRRAELDVLEEMRAAGDEGGIARAVRYDRAFDRARVGHRFFTDFKGYRQLVASAWRGVPERLVAEREQLALLLLCRLMFLYFLQRDGHLAGDASFLPRLVREWKPAPGRTFYTARLVPLFFGALNRRPERRDPALPWLAPLPYLNGGLFERHALERRFPGADLPDDALLGVFDGLLERYRFTSRESTERDVGAVNPEMLGRVFEGLMAPDRRSRTGTFYTPARTVDRLVAEALAAHVAGEARLPSGLARRLTAEGDVSGLDAGQRDLAAAALAGVRVLDPACGSGAFLLGALARLSVARSALARGRSPSPGDGRPGIDPGIARDVVGRSLFGVDLQDDAALLCALRLWLALAVTRTNRAVAAVEPLPNLDRRIRQGDALTDPLHLAVSVDSPVRPPPPPAALLAGVRELEALASRYVTAEPDDREALERAIGATEEALARRWVEWADRTLAHGIAEARAAAAERDLFGERPVGAQRADARLRALEARRSELAGVARVLEDSGALPFFSFRVHFCEAAEPGFDIVVSNPPWVRSHRWPATLGRAARQRFQVCRGGGWRGPGQASERAGAGAGQVDLSLLFLERSVELLRPGGTLAMVLPAKAFRSLYGAGARRLLLQGTDPLRIEDHGLDPKSIFHAGTFPGIVVARRRGPLIGVNGKAPPEPVRVVMTRQDREPLRFRLPAAELPVIPGDVASPWLLAPPAARAAIRRMQAAGEPLGTRHHPRRGVVTGANDALVFPHVEPKLAGLALVRAEGHGRARRHGRPEWEARRFAAAIEASALRPLVRGADVAAWRFRPSAHLFWSHDDVTCAALPAPARAAKYLARHEAALRARSGWRPGLPLGAVFRLAPDALGPKVAWRDLSTTLEAVAIPARLPSGTGAGQPVVPLNTIYFIAVPTTDDALLLAALLNSLPARVFARAMAERAKDGRFRFFAWTVSLLPLPAWRGDADRARVLALSRLAHERGALNEDDARELDRIAAAAYGLDDDHMRALAAFDAWLTGADT